MQKRDKCESNKENTLAEIVNFIEMETDKLIMPANDGEKTKVQLTGTQGTLLATLYARYLDLKSEYSVFGDRWAAHVVDQIDWDWSQFNFSGMFPYLISMRGRQIDAYTLRFLEKHKETGATVVRELYPPTTRPDV